MWFQAYLLPGLVAGKPGLKVETLELLISRTKLRRLPNDRTAADGLCHPRS